MVSRQRLVTLALLLGVLLLSGLPSLAAAQSDAEYFEQIVTGQVSGELLAGPYEFTLEQQEDVLSVFRAGVDVADFVAHAAFTNPTEDDGQLWDYGFQFRTIGDNQDLRLFVVSDGTWNFAIGPEVPEQTVAAPNLDTAPGAVNTLDLIVNGFDAIFGINGQFVGALSLPELAPSGDVYASTGFFGDLAIPGRTIGLSDFTIYGLPGTGAAPAAQAVIQDPADLQPRPVTLHSGSCDELGPAIQQLREATYPVGEFQGQASGVVAETSFTRIPNLLEELLLEPTAINVGQSFDTPDASIVCGDIGGVFDEIGGLILALPERNGSGYRGVAYLGADLERGGSNISVFLVPGQTAAPVEDVAVIEEGLPPATPEAVVTAAVGTPAATPAAGATEGGTSAATPEAMVIVIGESTPVAATIAVPASTPEN